MYIKLPDTYPYSPAQLKFDNPDVSFPAEMPDERLAEWGVFPVVGSAPPADSPTIDVRESVPTLIDGIWTQSWEIINLTSEQIAQKEATRIAERSQLRATAYQQESDPIFFKMQRGEATIDEWLAKIAEIKSRYS